jgi:glutamate racemase
LRILIFDSGLGGLTVYEQVAKVRPFDLLFYVADDAAFPYGALADENLVARVANVMDELIAKLSPDLIVIACNTASTLVLGPLRVRFPTVPFVGTVPAIKPAASATRSGLISVLGTRGTVARDYTQSLIRDYAGHCEVTLVGAPHLAALAESRMRGLPVADADIALEIAPCFVTRRGRRTDVVVLACTHYPLLSESLLRLAPWPVEFVDPAPAIARRVNQLLAPTSESNALEGPAPAIFTSGAAPSAATQKALAHYGLAACDLSRAASLGGLRLTPA